MFDAWMRAAASILCYPIVGMGCSRTVCTGGHGMKVETAEITEVTKTTKTDRMEGEQQASRDLPLCSF